jgi:hypothetical protein
MKCEEAERLIYLWKPGEADEGEQKLLKEHLQNCKECRMLAEEIKQAQRQAEILFTETSIGKDETFYKERIFAKANELEMRKSAGVADKVLRLTFSAFVHPLYKYVSAAVIAAMVFTFLLQNYMAYRHLGELENRFGNPSSYAAAAESKPIVLEVTDFGLIRVNSKNTNLKGIDLNWLKNNGFLLFSLRKHSLIRELASHKPGIDPIDLIKLYNHSIFTGESKRNQYKTEEKL